MPPCGGVGIRRWRIPKLEETVEPKSGFGTVKSLVWGVRFTPRKRPQGGIRNPQQGTPRRRDRPASETLNKTGSGQGYSITSSARASSVGGMVRPIAFAVFRLTTSS